LRHAATRFANRVAEHDGTAVDIQSVGTSVDRTAARILDEEKRPIRYYITLIKIHVFDKYQS
jgi:hypothetical protein